MHFIATQVHSDLSMKFQFVHAKHCLIENFQIISLKQIIRMNKISKLNMSITFVAIWQAFQLKMSEENRK